MTTRDLDAATAAVRTFLGEQHSGGKLKRDMEANEVRVFENSAGDLVPVLVDPDHLREGMPDPEGLQILIEQAHGGDRGADLQLRRLAGKGLGAGTPLPRELELYVASCLERPSPSRPRGTPASAYANRDSCIAWAVWLATQHGFDATRNDATRDKESGCSIVAAVLQELGIKVGERNIEAIWDSQRSLVAKLASLSQTNP